jgi:hypothetical protein
MFNRYIRHHITTNDVKNNIGKKQTSVLMIGVVLSIMLVAAVAVTGFSIVIPQAYACKISNNGSGQPAGGGDYIHPVRRVKE